jgi:hypothetical protein
VKETGDAIREERGTRAVGRASGEAVSTVAKEAAKKNKIAHLLHMRDREHMQEATIDGVLTGTSGLSKTGAAVLRKHGRRERNGGRHQGGKGDACRWKGTRRGSQHGREKAAKKNKTAHLLHMQDRERTREATNDGALTGTLGL